MTGTRNQTLLMNETVRESWKNQILLKEMKGVMTMTAKELQQRNEKADHLRVLQTDDGQYFVESGEGKDPLQRDHQR